MTWDILIGCTIIIIARIGDVSFGTMRMVAVINGHRGLAWLFGLIETTIWVFVVSAVVAHIRTEPAYGVAFAVGAATGNYIGVTLQRWLPSAGQVVRVFTRQGEALFNDLSRRNFRVTKFEGVGRGGAITMLFVQINRLGSPLVVHAARKLDPQCFYTIDDIRAANAATITTPALPTITPP